MKSIFKNSEYDAFFETICAYNSNTLINKSDYEILLAGLKVYLKIESCSSATLFSVDHHTFDFYYRTSTQLHLEDTLKITFEQLVDSGAVAETINSSDVREYPIEDNDGLGGYCLLVPLFVPSGIIGMNLILLDRSIKERKPIIDLCRLFSNNFAAIVHSCILSRELTELSENTEQKIALRTSDISKNTRELKKILDSIQTGILIINKSTGFIADVNFLAADIIGATKKDLIGKKADDYFFFLGNQEYNRESKTSREGLLKRNNGKLLPILKTEVEVSLGETILVLESFIDISERKKMEDELLRAQFELERRVEERTSQLSAANLKLEEEILAREKAEDDILKLYWAVAQSPVAILITDLNGVIEYVNDKFIEMTGYKYEEAIGANPRILKSGDLAGESYKELWDTLLEEKEWEGEHRNKKKNGDFYWASTHIRPIRNTKGEITHYLGIQEDITEKKLMLDELIVAKNRAEESARVKSSLLANMSHEFRTPLIGVLGFSQLLAADLKDDEQLEMARGINQAGNRLLDTLDGVLNLSELSSIESSLKFGKINVAELLKEFSTTHLNQAIEKNLEMKLKLTGEELFVLAESDLLKRSICKIYDNAIKYTTKGTVTISAERKRDTDKDWILISICDTGIGIAERDQEIIFEAFRQASEGYTRDFEGCGLGLTLSKAMIEVMHGRITVTSQPSIGSEFTIWLPALN